MPKNEQKNHSATARHNDALARLKEEERRFKARQKIILGGALIALRRKNGEAGAKLLRTLIPYISQDDRSTVSDLLEVKDTLPFNAPSKLKASHRRDAVVVAAARLALRKDDQCSDGSEDADDVSDHDRAASRSSRSIEEQ